ncbi:hypothetical protein CHGG_03307 [Chaetomium globosum CBS 148.51]|uniref:LRR-containing protein second PH domain-containing protein n=1 Tax=Chaetomium globosum (strain ATCC 6205 / CBS 148.51 / DSM 1962 / NBRC 6347 / NRRL 1970) TaxID=306901 RepID=Q2H8Z7_CHAGB|nr:uncharacterized protein CHGG_03307 [Chaetomium globosum CBS 148.51]EAQ91372.1 hypothetical protein CHGG_03307 [Chaetomium globosum CBS 148.51]
MAVPDLLVKKRPTPGGVTISKSDSFDSNASPSTPDPNSPASFDSGHRSFSISSIKGRAWRSFSSKEKGGTPDAGHSFRTHARRLSKSRPISSSSHTDGPSRRGSTVSDDHSRLSLSTADSLSLVNASSASSSVDWSAQHVEGFAALESDTLLLKTKTKTPYLVVTTNYLLKTKSRADAVALIPGLAAEGSKPESSGSGPEPLLVIPTDAIVSVFAAESTRPSFGIEVWWRSPLAGHSFCRSDFFFTDPTQRNEQLHHITRSMRAGQQQDEDGAARHSQDVKAVIKKIHEVEEPRFHHWKPEIIPVVPRGATRRGYMPKLEDATKKSQEGPAFYLVVGTYLCHLVEVQKGKGGDAVCRHKSYGLVTLESFKGEWVMHEERFNITFREPFKSPVALELASRYYRHIIRVFGTSDRFLKPAWPQLWQSMEIFHVSGLKEPQYLVPKEDFGSFKRTLDGYLAAYHCQDVDWEINWKTRFAPEFRLLPGKRGPYSSLQLLAVLRALRYNDYFTSLSFRDVDLSVLHGLQDNTLRKVNVAYLSRTCVALGPDEIETLRVSPVLHQEFHALAFCSEKIRQIDFGNCSRSLSSRMAQYNNQPQSLQFLAPILSLLRSGITKCNRLIVSGNTLPPSDVEDLAETMKCGTIQALDVSYCGLDDASLREVIVDPLSDCPGLLQTLSISGNPGRLPAHILPGLFRYLTEIRELNLSGSIQAESFIEGSLLPFTALESMERLEELDVSGYKLDDATSHDLERFLQYRNWRADQGQPLRFHKLVLNHCRITGTQAARLFHAIGENRGMHLCLSGNPIEDGIEDLAAAITSNQGPAGLYLEMIEFKHEANYLTLLEALTTTRHLTLLSLAGHRPLPRLPRPLHLDLSGFSGKLDDGQLPPGAGRALSGLATNTTLTHLRIRNQNLHSDAGVLGRALALNSTLRALDCRGNGLNLTSLRFLVDSLAAPTSAITEFPCPADERAAVWRTVLRGLQRTPSSAAVSALGTVSAAAAASAGAAVAVRDLLKGEEVLLRGVLDGLWERLEGCLRENRRKLGVVVDGNMAAGGAQQGYRHRHRRSSSAGLGGGGGGVFPGEEEWSGFDVVADTGVGLGIGTGGSGAPSRWPSTDSEPGSSSGNSSGVPKPTIETPAEGQGRDQAQVRVVVGEADQEEVEGDDLFRKMVDDFRKAGFEV